jgi:hypothetical protein
MCSKKFGCFHLIPRAVKGDIFPSFVTKRQVFFLCLYFMFLFYVNSGEVGKEAVFFGARATRPHTMASIAVLEKTPLLSLADVESTSIGYFRMGTSQQQP